ncbi:MAG: hypothetical protein U0Z53_05805 [Blastocatellia bacterium]
MFFIRCCRSIMVLTLSGVLALAQSPAANSSPPGAPQKEQQQAREKNALALLDDLLAEISLLRLPENRVSIQMAAADLLWKRDETRARQLYREATASLSEILAAATVQNDDETEEIGYPVRQLWDQLRFRMLSRVIEHDVRLAQELLIASRPPEAANDPDARDQREKEFEMRLAVKLAESDPPRAYQLAEEKLASGARDAVPEVLEFLQNLIEKDPTLAAKLARSLLKKIQADAGRNQEPPYLLSRLLSILSVPGVNDQNSAAKSGGKDDKSRTSRIDEAVIREAVEAMASQTLALLSDGSQSNFQRSQYAWFALSELQRLMPLAEKYIPSRLPVIRARLAEMEKGMPPEMKTMREMDALFQKGDPEAVLAAASRLPSDQAQFLYYRVAEDAVTKGDLDKARQIMSANLKDPNVRRQLEMRLEQQAMQTAIEKGKLDEVRPLMERVRSTRERIGILTQMAGVEIKKGNKKAALQLLEEARTLVGNRAASRAQLEAQMTLAGGYAEVDPARSFELLETAVSRINELMDAVASLGGFFPVSASRDNEMLMVEEGGPFTEFLHQHAEALTLLLTADFDHVKNVVGRFERPEIKAFVRLNVAESVLAEHREGETRVSGSAVAPVMVGSEAGGPVVIKPVVIKN